MQLTRNRPTLRRLATALATAQLLSYGAAPVLHGLTDRNPGPAHIEAASERSCVPLHAASACIACQMLTLQARRPDPARAFPGDDCARVVDDAVLLAAPARAPPPGYLTRAPPTRLG